ncbi:uncharacterized protein LOC130761152 [Actinidia eriantha]|uniref:uncharacterized protein LOC130761152 n=1 Tax=Actinidia eriantha TaxID=165200 RepID=UPI002589782E|nr:uncharacterized protein LOC130761152 [Actinidia eriantha]
MASRMLSNACYNHCEISSHCKSSFECKHNLTYWENKPFYGFGLGSASYLNGLRFSRPRKMKEYMDYVQNLEDGVVEHRKDYFPDAKDMAMDAVMLYFRTAKWFDFKAFKETFGSSLVHSLCKAYGPYVDSGRVICLDQQRKTITADQFFSLSSDGHEIENTLGFIRLGDPDSFLLSNELISLAFRIISP